MKAFDSLTTDQQIARNTRYAVKTMKSGRLVGNYKSKSNAESIAFKFSEMGHRCYIVPFIVF